MTIKRILGFDISSSTVGHCLLEWDDQTNDIKFVDCGYYKPMDHSDIIHALAITHQHFAELIAQYHPDYIGIEDVIQFMKGESTAKTIIPLALFNRTIGLAAHQYLGHSPALFNVLTIRHGLKLTKKLPDKKEMPELVAKHLDIAFPYLYGKRGGITVECGDMADGIAVALYYAYILSGKIVSKAPKPKTKKPRKRKKSKKTKKKH